MHINRLVGKFSGNSQLNTYQITIISYLVGISVLGNDFFLLPEFNYHQAYADKCETKCDLHKHRCPGILAETSVVIIQFLCNIDVPIGWKTF